VVKTRKINWTGHVASWERRKASRILRTNSKERHHFEKVVIHWRTVLKMTFKTEVGLWTGFVWLRIGRSGGFSIRLW